MSVINTNITSMIAQQNLSSSKGDLTTAMERLSSGLRINSAKDDAAGQAIANRMSAQITGLSTAQRNANDGISIAQTAEGGLDQINDNLQRIRELTVQAQNGTNSASDIDSIQQEVNERLAEINRIAEETDFNGSKILSESAEEGLSIKIQVGSEDGQTISIDIASNTGWNQFAETSDDTGYVSTEEMREVGGAKRTVAAQGFDVLSSSASRLVENNVDISGLDESDFSNAKGEVDFVKDTNTDQLYIRDRDTTAASIDASDTSKLFGMSGDGGRFVRDDADDLYVQVAGSDAGSARFVKVDSSMINDDGVVELDAQKVDSGDLLSITDLDDSGDFDTGDYATVASTAAVSAADTLGRVTETTYYAVSQSMINDDGSSFTETDFEDDEVFKSVDGPELGEFEVVTANDDYQIESERADPLGVLDDALKAVDEQRSQLGAIQNRFESAITNLQTNETNLSAARSRIEDADYATEVANMTKAQILQQAGTSVLAQANQVPQSVLSLLG